MKIEDIVTDKDGLQKIIDFLHSEQNVNLRKSEPGQSPLFTFCFHLGAVQTKYPEVTYVYGGKDEVMVRYRVTLQTHQDHNPDKPFVDSLLQLVQEVYKM